MCRSSPLRSALNMCASAKECHHPHPTPPYRGWLCVEKMMQNCACDSSLCARVTLENGGVRTWLQSVCAGDSGWKKWCKIVPVCTCDSRVCARVTPWPSKYARMSQVMININKNLMACQGNLFPFKSLTTTFYKAAIQYPKLTWLDLPKTSKTKVSPPGSWTVRQFAIPQRKPDGLPSIIFQGRTLKLRGRFLKATHWDHWHWLWKDRWELSDSIWSGPNLYIVLADVIGQPPTCGIKELKRKHQLLDLQYVLEISFPPLKNREYRLGHA